jgi:hypothetical protein
VSLPQNLKGKGGIKSEIGTPESAGRKSLESGTPHRDLFRNSFNEFSGAGAMSAGRGGPRESTKADAKVLEWGSFAPTVIREYYLSKMQQL